ncbi:MAG TPA: efflux RND transporter permease subunit, partial [Caulobacter sp.]|nr:efflux RND transporter permease subunit [Caulobacter sp.]
SYLQFDVDRSAAVRAGLSVQAIQSELRAQLEGSSAGMVFEPGRRTPIIVRGLENLRDDPGAFLQTQIATPDGGLVRAADVASVARREGPVKIDRENASRFAVIQAYVSGRDLVGFVKEAQANVA